jgi:hypothetical protein
MHNGSVNNNDKNEHVISVVAWAEENAVPRGWAKGVGKYYEAALSGCHGIRAFLVYSRN